MYDKLIHIMRKLILIAVMLAGVYSAGYAQTKDWAKFSKYSEQNDTVTVTPKAVFMGDSITEGWFKKKPAFFSDNNFLGRGISGQTTSHMLVRFRRDVLDFKPKYVVILAGTNDIAMNNGYIELENILGNIMSMCEIAKANRIRPVICSVLPCSYYPWRPEVKDPAGQIIKLNTMLKEYAKAEKIKYVDYHSVLKDDRNGLPEKYAKDGVHPGHECLEIMQSIILEAL